MIYTSVETPQYLCAECFILTVFPRQRTCIQSDTNNSTSGPEKLLYAIQVLVFIEIGRETGYIYLHCVRIKQIKANKAKFMGS